MYNSCLIQLLFTKKNNFFTKFSSNFELSIKFTQIKKVRFIDVIIPLRSVSTNVSNCIVLNFMYTKFQVSSSKKWQSYWYSNMVHLLLITLYYRSDITVSQDIVEIYKDTDVNGILGYSCPFCNFEPTTSDIRFRKHLKQNHPKQKILLKDKESRKNPNIPFELDSSKSVFSLLNNKENQLLGISLQSAKVWIST